MIKDNTTQQARITKHVMFSAAHHIPDADKCSKNHGHNWYASITVDQLSGSLDSRGFVVDVRELKDAAFKYDHDDLNNYFEYPSTENIAQKIADDALEICRQNPEGVYIVNVTLKETEANSADASASNFSAQFKEPLTANFGSLEGQIKKAHDAETAYQYGGSPIPAPQKAQFIRRVK